MESPRVPSVRQPASQPLRRSEEGRTFACPRPSQLQLLHACLSACLAPLHGRRSNCAATAKGKRRHSSDRRMIALADAVNERTAKERRQMLLALPLAVDRLRLVEISLVRSSGLVLPQKRATFAVAAKKRKKAARDWRFHSIAQAQTQTQTEINQSSVRSLAKWMNEHTSRLRLTKRNSEPLAVVAARATGVGRPPLAIISRTPR